MDKGERQGKGLQSLSSHMQNEEMSLGGRLACMCMHVQVTFTYTQCRNIKHTQKCFNTKTSCAFIAALFSILPLFFHRCSWLSTCIWLIQKFLPLWHHFSSHTSVSKIVTIQFNVYTADEGLGGWNIHNSCNRGHAFTSSHCSNHCYTTIFIGKMDGF